MAEQLTLPAACRHLIACAHRGNKPPKNKIRIANKPVASLSAKLIDEVHARDGLIMWPRQPHLTLRGKTSGFPNRFTCARHLCVEKNIEPGQKTEADRGVSDIKARCVLSRTKLIGHLTRRHGKKPVIDTRFS